MITIESISACLQDGPKTLRQISFQITGAPPTPENRPKFYSLLYYMAKKGYIVPVGDLLDDTGYHRAWSLVP